jgi:hypothetical protein
LFEHDEVTSLLFQTLAVVGEASRITSAKEEENIRQLTRGRQRNWQRWMYNHER